MTPNCDLGRTGEPAKVGLVGLCPGESRINGRINSRITVRAYGESVSLGIKSSPELDEKLLALTLYIVN